jgi:5-(carboxyamino)imidazole ribonucleotide synthase
MKRIGIIGGGQLAWMMADAARELGIEVVVQTPSPDDVAVSMATETVLAEVDDVAATEMLASKCDWVTFENEFVDLEGLGKLAANGVCFRPSLTTLAPLLDKYTQRCYLDALSIPVPRFHALRAAELPAGFSFPVVIKSRRNGYDGQGTFIIKDLDALQSLFHLYPDTPFLIEEFIKFDRELALIVVRGATGETISYPLLETQQEDSICRRVFTLSDVPDSTIGTCEAIASKLLASLDAIGVFAIELFVMSDGKVLVNEIAPRNHNSGHLTIEACATSQFSQIIRAVSGLPLGDTALTCGGAVMINLLGYESADDRDYLSQRQQIGELSHTYVHWYEKNRARIGRKLGHVTILLDRGSPDRQLAEDLARQVEKIWYGNSQDD